MKCQPHSPPPGRSDLQQLTEGAFHRWYSSVLGFPDHLVGQLLTKLNIGSNATILDPFCGTGTTLIECSKHKIQSIGIDANPFFVFAALAKSSFGLDPVALERAASRVEQRYYAILSKKKGFTGEVTYLYLNESGMIQRGWISPNPRRAGQDADDHDKCAQGCVGEGTTSAADSKSAARNGVGVQAPPGAPSAIRCGAVGRACFSGIGAVRPSTARYARAQMA